MNSIEIRQQRAELVAQSKAWLSSVEQDGNPLTSEQEGEWAKRMSDVDKLEAEAKAAERREKLDHVEADLKAPVSQRKAPSFEGFKAPSKAERNKVLKAWLGYNSGAGSNVSGDLMHRAAELGMPLHQGSITSRSMNTATSGAGGAGTFITTFPELQTEMKYYAPIIDKVKVQVTGDGNNFVLPRGTDVANTMSIVAQSGTSGTTTDPTFDKVTLGAYFYRYIELVSYEMLQDAVFDVESWLTSRLAERAGRTLEKQIVAGTGSSAPTGLIAAATAADGGTPDVVLAATHKNLYSFDDLMNLFYGVDLAYRPNCTLVLHDSSVWDLRKIKDSQNRYIWDVNNTLVQNMQPDKIAGFNYLISNSMDASGAFSKNLCVFADLSRHVVRMVDGIQITRLNELYRSQGAIGFEVGMRFDCNYVGHPASIARLGTPAS